ncbi:hypothetical protein SBADM41S_09279 [Streptomyces badius]
MTSRRLPRWIGPDGDRPERDDDQCQVLSADNAPEVGR